MQIDRLAAFGKDGLARVRLYSNAVRTARKRQLLARLRRPINRRRVRAKPRWSAARTLPGAEELWRSPAFSIGDEVARNLGEGRINVLSCDLPYPPSDWNVPGLERLRRFHLHSGEEILGCARSGQGALVQAARRGLASWIDANPPGRGDGWHPYAVSTRVGNWLAAITLEPSLACDAAHDSLWRQLVYLERNVEDDILGNHVLRNARALILGGLAFDERRFERRGIELLDRELPEQVLADGGHYERSPCYHAIALRDLLEIRDAGGFGFLDDTIGQMLHFAAATARPDGLPALFNDGARDLAPDLSRVLPRPPEGLVVFPETGYAILRTKSVWLAFDCGPPAPPFLPPHAHADALSFQLWIDGAPLVTDPGTPTYEPGPSRDQCRSTRAHSTVTVDGRDQFRLWGAFRTGRLPRVELLSADGHASAGSLVAAACEFEPLPGLRHERRISWDSDAIHVDDFLEGSGTRLVESGLPLAPASALDAFSFKPSDGTVEVETRDVAERLFDPRPAPAIVSRRRVQLPTELGWRIKLASAPLSERENSRH